MRLLWTERGARWGVIYAGNTHHTIHTIHTIHAAYDHLKGISPPYEPRMSPIRSIRHTNYGARRMAYGATLVASHPELPQPLALRWAENTQQHTLALAAAAAPSACGGIHLPDALTQLSAALRSYQDLWDCLEDFDAHTLVLEPPQTASTAADTASTASRALIRSPY
jgi:hypothetical protein